MFDPILDILYIPRFFNQKDSFNYFNYFKSLSTYLDPVDISNNSDMPWMAWYGDHVLSKKLIMDTQINLWNNELLEIKEKVEFYIKQQHNIIELFFNSVLINFYKNGDTYAPWHFDEISRLQAPMIIASISFGDTRTFCFKYKENNNIKHCFKLNSGDLFIMKKDVQKYWEHTIIKTKEQFNQRINLTFRNLIH